MAHGGSPEWNRTVAEAVAPLRELLPTALAFGMADPGTLQASLDSLRQRGVTTTAVVRVFLSGASFLHQTEYLFGLRDDAPAQPMVHSGAGHGGHVLHPLEHGMDIRLSRDGLGASEVSTRIMADRARSSGVSPERADVVLVAHGMGDDEEDAQVLAHMEGAAEELRRMGFRTARSVTLREDWPAERVVAEARIREWVEAAARRGSPALVVPFRLSGFGPYAEVLEGLSYRSTEGMLPHPLVTLWIEEQARGLLCPGVGGGADACALGTQGR
jgi:sirohydrochlorin ferrochelatase